MLFLQITTLLAGVASALPSSTSLAARQTCSSPRLRKGWSTATVEERLAYLDAAVCVTKKPSRLGNHPNATLHDDFAYTHAVLNDQSKFPSAPTSPWFLQPSTASTDSHYLPVHEFAPFLPWHRYFVMVYEKALQDCGYKGTAMYWDWVADSNDPAKSAVWDPVTGFGGNGQGTSTHRLIAPPVQDGPFKHHRPLYWGTSVDQHSLSRAWARANSGNPDDRDLFGHRYTPEIVAGVLANSSYDGFRSALEGGPHASVHFGVAVGAGIGKKGDLVPASSPNGKSNSRHPKGPLLTPNPDPIFFLHHTQVDRLWWIWQQADKTRTMAYDGFHRPPPNAPDGETGPPVTLKDTLPMGGLALDGIVEDFMDTTSVRLCYEY